MSESLAETLSYDPIHGYIPFVSRSGASAGNACERDLIDHPWLQRLRQIHQLQTAWWVFPSAEHTRFQHVLGVMHLASCAIEQLYPSLQEVCEDVPSRAYVESLMRVAGLLHDVGHGPFGHFFDEHFLQKHGLTHETLGARIIVDELGTIIAGIRENPSGRLAADEQLDPEQVAWLIVRPETAVEEASQRPLWLVMLRSLLSGIYTIDNMDFVLRDAYMAGYSPRSYDLARLLRYSFFSASGLTIHDRGMDALMRFLSARAELFQAIYFHRTVRSIDLALQDLFSQSVEYLFEGNPLDDLESYRRLTESSLLVDVSRWPNSEDATLRELGRGWQQILERRLPWQLVCQRNLLVHDGDAELASIFSSEELVEQQLKNQLGRPAAELELRVDIARHIFRPHTHGPASGQNYLYDSASDTIRPLESHELYGQLPVAQRICRVYSRDKQGREELTAALDQLICAGGRDDLTNM